MKYFWIDPTEKLIQTYSDLLRDLNKKRTHQKYIYHRSPYQILLDLISCLAAGSETHLLDSDFSRSEITNLGIEESEISSEISITNSGFENFQSLLSTIEKYRRDSSIYIYTSGTTGRPKKVRHNLETLTRTVKTGKKFENDLWGFAYNITHFAGIQVFLQAFLNQNPMIYIFPLSGKLLFQALNDYKVTNISATPTFYRKLCTDITRPVPSVKRLTLGGEKYDPYLEKELQKIFPGAVLRNIYASTEAGSLFNSSSDIFEISDDLRSLVRITDEGELLVHKNLLGQFDSQELTGEWYHTGDLVERIDSDHFRFLSRKTEMINVGGYKVNPHEVEEEIRKIFGVLDARIIARPNRITGNILMAEVVKDNHFDGAELEKIIFDILEERIQSFKIPRIIRFVPELQLTRTGKKERI